MPCYNIHITGAVFKTGFRYFLKAKASHFGISGCVYYENDRTVNVIASGNPGDIDKFLDFCKVGSHFVHITKTEIVEIPTVEFNSFDVWDEAPGKIGFKEDLIKSNQ